MHKNQGVEFYERHAITLAEEYEAVSFENAYPFLVQVLSGEPIKILDIGAGTGRDAAWIAAHGHDVCAVEPSAAMRKIAKFLHPNKRITWVDSRLPVLQAAILKPNTFDIVLAHAVWMHIAPEEREHSMRRIRELLNNKGTAYVSLRIGPQDEQRGMFSVSSNEFVALAKTAGFKVVHRGDFPDLLGRMEISWKMYELKKFYKGIFRF